MNATSNQLNQRSNQHVKLSKHLSTKMQSIHRSKNTHIHTLTHSYTHTQQVSLILYFKNKLQQFSEHILTHVSLVMDKYIVPTHVSKVAKNLSVVCEKHSKSA